MSEVPARVKKHLRCTADDWYELAKEAGKKGETVKVNRGALDRLMGDHSLFIEYHRSDLQGII